jgi:hypothetical protein
MNLSTILGGIAGGLAGALIWVLVGYFTGYEVGYIAWGIGLLAGAGLRYFASKSEIEESTAQGIAAAVIAIACILLGKFGVAYLAVSNAKQEVEAELERSPITDVDMVRRYAHEIANAREADGKSTHRPDAKAIMDDDPKNDFPTGVWEEAERKWKNVPAAEREAAIQREKEELRESTIAIFVPDVASVFTESFAFWDLLWAFLAVGTAYKIGAGSYSNE